MNNIFKRIWEEYQSGNCTTEKLTEILHKVPSFKEFVNYIDGETTRYELKSYVLKENENILDIPKIVTEQEQLDELLVSQLEQDIIIDELILNSLGGN